MVIVRWSFDVLFGFELLEVVYALFGEHLIKLELSQHWDPSSEIYLERCCIDHCLMSDVPGKCVS